MIDLVLDGKYRITRLIGSGGMSNVYRGVEIASKRVVAIKVLKDEFSSDAEFVRRFQREAQAVLNLSHENIVSLIDVGKDGDIYYIVLEYIDGETLKDMIRRKTRIGYKQATTLACQILDGLEHAHDKGIVHRDIKPQNILINYKGKPKIADFGIARDVQSSTVTFSGNSIVGSVHYLSPEQARGEQVGPQSDIYSMGIMLYEMVLGKVPFYGDTTVSIALKHLNEEITPPVQLDPDIPRSLSDIILKATSKKPENRYASAKDMRTDLLRSLKDPDGDFVLVAGALPGVSAVRPKRSRRRGVAHIAFGVMLGIAIFAVMFVMGSAILKNLQASKVSIAPKLIEKTLEEAQQIADARGFTLEISDTVSSEIVGEGYIVTQDPVAGTEIDPGSKIKVTVSGGPSEKIMPKLENLTLIQAREQIELIDAKINRIMYDETSTKPAGYVIRQEPAAGEELYANDEITVWVSGAPAEEDLMPALTGLTQTSAITEVMSRGLTDVLIRFSEPESEAQEGTVVKQLPEEGTVLSGLGENNQVELWIARANKGEYTVDVAYNLEITQESQVLITLQEPGGAQRVVYEATLAKGVQPVSLALDSDEPGIKQLTIYIDGQEVRQEDVQFK
jgi:serine/threonine-protein kinase